MNLNNCILVTHQECHDGSSCAILFIEAGGKRENVFFANANRPETCVEENNLFERPEFIIIADVSFKEKDFIDKLEKRGDFTLIDHHETALHLKDRSWAVIDTSVCATELLRRYLNLNSKVIIRYTKLVDDIDRWQRKLLPDSERLVEYHDFLGQDEYIKKFTSQDNGRWDPYWDKFLFHQEEEFVKIIIERRDRSIEKSLKNIRSFDVKIGNDILRFGYALNKSSNLLFDKMLYELGYDVAAGFNMSSGGVSLRTKQNINAANIAKLYGGGGHLTSAGHRMSKDFIDEFISEIHGGEKCH